MHQASYLRHTWQHHDIMHIMPSCSCYLSTWCAYSGCRGRRLRSCWGIISNAVCDSNRNNKRDRPLLPRAPTYHDGVGHHRPLRLMAFGYHPLIPSSPRPLRPSSPRPLRPSAPQPDPDHQASLLHQPWRGAHAMGNGNEERLWGHYGVWASLNMVLSLSLEIIKNSRMVNMHGL